VRRSKRARSQESMSKRLFSWALTYSTNLFFFNLFSLEWKVRDRCMSLISKDRE
jgi:hypothetical protein